MKRPNRNIEIFSMSALDLFASAMGAFVLIAIILIPYYRMKAPTLAEINALEQAVNDQKAENTELKKQLEAANVLAFLGIVSKADSFVILIDMSSSMNKYEDLMDRTTSQILGALNDSHSVQIIGFQGSNPGALKSWQPSKTLVVMNAGNQKAASDFVAQISRQFNGGTPTETALRAALAYDSEAIILLSDGAPNGNPDAIVKGVSATNSGKKEIHSVAIGDYGKKSTLVKFLTDLAKSNGGQFTGVSK